MNHTQSPEIGYALDRGLEMGGLGWKLVPIPFGFKYPKGFGKWQEIATDDEATIRGWFEATTHGIGWAMGAQPNGRNVFAVDVEHDGMESLVDLINANGADGAPFLNTASQHTGGDGAHYVFETVTVVRNSAKQFAPHIDIRGEGGQILVGPTIHPNGNPYRWSKLPDETRPLPAPKWVLDRIEAQNEAAPQTSKQVWLGHINDSLAGLSSDDDSPADWVRQNIPIGNMLSQAGWQYMEHRGDDSYWCRPGKNPRQGHSAVLHGDAPLVVFTTECLWRGGRDNRDGSTTFSPAALYAAIHHGGDIRAMSSHVRQNMMPRANQATARERTASTPDTPVAPPTIAGHPNLPAKFWDSRPDLTHIRDAAWSRGLSPDAVLGAILTRISAITPVGHRIPPIIGTTGTYDHLTVLVGHSSGGKTAAAGVAEELIPDTHEKTVVWDWPAPSGEGLIDAFFEMVDEIDANGKKTRTKKQTKTAVHFTIDEGMALISQTQRSGTTIASVILSAWSGSTIGQGNASDDRKRVIKKGRARVAGLMGIQTKLGHQLLADNLIDQGLSGRLVFFAAEDPTMPDRHQIPDYPGPLTITPPPTIPNHQVEYPQHIWDEVRDNHWAKMRLQTIINPIDGHQNLVKLKLAGLLTFLDNRQTVTQHDWELAKHIIDSSNKVRKQMLAYRHEATQAALVTQGTAAATRLNAQEDADHRIKISKAANAITTALKTHGPLNKKNLKQHISSPLRQLDILNTALQELEAAGLIHKDEEGVYK